MSQPCRHRSRRYAIIKESTQKGTLDITPWMTWFLGCLGRAIDGAETTLSGVLRKARFWQAHAAAPLNDRQRKVLNRLLDGFEGRLTSTKWARLAKCSQDTAGRDIHDLIQRGILTPGPPAGGARAMRWPIRGDGRMIHEPPEVGP